MHIWWVNQYIRPASQGGGRHAVLGDHLSTLGHRVTLIGSDFDHSIRSARTPPPPLDPRQEAVRFVPLRTRGYRTSASRLGSMLGYGRAVSRLKHEVGAQRPDIIIGSSPHLFAALGAYRLARNYGVPFVLEVRDIWPMSLSEVGGVHPRHPIVQFLKRIERYLYLNSDAIIGTMPRLNMRVSEVVSPPPPVYWIPTPAPSSSRLYEHPVPAPSPNVYKVTYTGAHGPPNSLQTLLQAAQLLRNQRTGDGRVIQFHLYGTGAAKESLRRDASARGLDNVHFHEPVPKNDVPRILAASDALVICWRNSKLYTYGVSPNKLTDYILAERPIIQALSADVDTVTNRGGGIQVRAEDPAALAEAVLTISALSAAELGSIVTAATTYYQQVHAPERNASALADVLSSLVRP